MDKRMGFIYIQLLGIDKKGLLIILQPHLKLLQLHLYIKNFVDHIYFILHTLLPAYNIYKKKLFFFFIFEC